MSEYKLVPVEPTPEMLAEIHIHEAFTRSALRARYQAMLAAAPAVQGEAEQPPLQLPDFVKDPDDSDEVASLWDHGFKRGWNSCLEAVAKAMQPAEQQREPCHECGGDGAGGEHEEDCSQQVAPDVAGLVEALEKARDAIGSLPQDALGNVPDTQQLQGWHIRDELINDISTALAAWRGDDGEYKYLGSFDTRDEAESAYIAASIEMHGEFSIHRKQQETSHDN